MDLKLYFQSLYNNIYHTNLNLLLFEKNEYKLIEH